MKNIFFTLLIFAGVISVSNGQTPKKVLDALSFKYKGAESIEWLKVDGTFNASFEHNGLSKTASFKNDGSWIQTTIDLPISELLSCIDNYLKEEYPTAMLIAVEFLETPDVERYHVLLEIDEVIYNDDEEEVTSKSFTLIFDEDCQLIDNE